MLKLVVTIVAAGLPTLFYLRVIQSVDRYEKEPTRYLVAAFLWGAVPAVIAGLVIEMILDVPVTLILGAKSLAGQLASTALSAPVVEELLKACAVGIIYLMRRREFDGWVDGLVYGATAGFGFAFVENLFYLGGTKSWGEWVGLFFLRVIVFGMMHGFWTSLTGIGFGIARNLTNPTMKGVVVILGLGAAIFSHMLHNGALVLASATNGASFIAAIGNYFVLLILLLCLRVVAARNDRNIMQTYLRDETPGTLSPEAYAVLCSTKSHAMANLRLAPREERKFIQAAAELAQKKREFLRMGDEGGNGAEIEKLRGQLAVLGR
jgi:RsiW-degrading membrane proteinase PrsW (M82 family)